MASAVNSYFIDSRYRARQVAGSELHSGYWTPKRIDASAFHQYYVYQYAMRIIHTHKYRSVIDVGCGPGTKLAQIHRRFPDLRIVGVDLPEPIDYCRATHKFGEWISHDVNLVCPSRIARPADLVICADVLEHVEQPDRLLAFLRDLSKPLGHILLSTPDRDALNGPGCLSPRNLHHVREWTMRELHTYLIASSFQVKAHFLQYPVRIWPNRIFLREILLRAIAGKRVKYNQLALLSPR